MKPIIRKRLTWRLRLYHQPTCQEKRSIKSPIISQPILSYGSRILKRARSKSLNRVNQSKRLARMMYWTAAMYCPVSNSRCATFFERTPDITRNVIGEQVCYPSKYRLPSKIRYFRLATGRKLPRLGRQGVEHQ